MRFREYETTSRKQISPLARTRFAIASRFRQWVGVLTGVRVFWVMILCRLWISGGFDQVSSDFWLMRHNPTLPPGTVSHDWVQIAHFVLSSHSEFVLSSHSESTQHIGLYGSFLTFMTSVRVRFWLFEVISGQSHRICYVLLHFRREIRNQTITRHTIVRKVRNPYRHQILHRFRIWTQECVNSRNRDS